MKTEIIIPKPPGKKAFRTVRSVKSVFEAMLTHEDLKGRTISSERTRYRFWTLSYSGSAIIMTERAGHNRPAGCCIQKDIIYWINSAVFNPPKSFLDKCNRNAGKGGDTMVSYMSWCLPPVHGAQAFSGSVFSHIESYCKVNNHTFSDAIAWWSIMCNKFCPEGLNYPPK